MNVDNDAVGRAEQLFGDGKMDYEHRCDQLTEALQIAHQQMVELQGEVEEVVTERDEALERVSLIEEGIAQLQNGEMGDLGAAFSQFANQGTTASDEVVQDLEAEIDELRAQLQETEENLQDSRSTLAREREFAELINQDNEDAQQQQAELQQTLLRSQNLETEFKKSKAERAELQDQLQEAHEAAAALELQIGQLKDGLEQERDARHRQAEELEFANARSAELESTLMAAQSQHEVAQTEINELKLHNKTTETQYMDEISSLRNTLADTKMALADQESVMQRYEDDIIELRAGTPSSADNSPGKQMNQSSISTEFNTAMGGPSRTVTAEVERAQRLMRSELDSISEEADLTECVTAIIHELRAKEILRSQLERTSGALQRRAETSAATLQERTTLVVKSTKLIERSMKRLSKHTGVLPIASTPQNQESTDVLGKRTEDAIERLGKQITELDFHIEGLKNENKSNLEKLSQQKGVEAETIKAGYEEKLKVVGGFGCKYLGYTPVPTSRPEQKELWQAIDRIRRENATPKMIVVSSSYHTTHRNQAFVSTMYGRAQDGTPVVSKPFATFCSVGQVEMFVIYLCYTRDPATKKRNFFVHALSCANNAEAEVLSKYLIKQCESAHEYRKTIASRREPAPVAKQTASGTAGTRIGTVRSAGLVPRRKGMAAAQALAKKKGSKAPPKQDPFDLVLNLQSEPAKKAAPTDSSKAKAKTKEAVIKAKTKTKGTTIKAKEGGIIKAVVTAKPRGSSGAKTTQIGSARANPAPAAQVPGFGQWIRKTAC